MRSRTSARSWLGLVLACCPALGAGGAPQRTSPREARPVETREVAGVRARLRERVELAGRAPSRAAEPSHDERFPEPPWIELGARDDSPRPAPGSADSPDSGGDLARGLPPCDGLASEPALASVFGAGADDDTTGVPDAAGGVGPEHVVAMLSNGITVHSRAGAPVLDASLATFWSPLGATLLRQPRIHFDATHARWLASILEGPAGAERVLFAISDTDDPTGAWSHYALYADPGASSRPDWLAMGTNGTWVALTANMFGLAGTPFLGAKMWVLDLASALVPGGPLTVSTFATGFASVSGFDSSSLMPTRGLDAGAGLYLTANGFAAAGTPLLQGFRITGSGAAPLVTPLAGSSFGANAGLFAVTSSHSFFQRAMPQADDPREIAPFSIRVASAVARGGHLWLAHTAGLPGPSTASPTHTTVCWYEVDPSALPNPIVQSGQVSGGAGSAYTMPSLAVNCAGDALLGFSSGDATRYAEASFCLRLAADPPGTMRPVRRLRAGASSYWRDAGVAATPWGRYGSTAVDPVDDETFWTLQQSASERAGPLDSDSRFETTWGEISSTPPPYWDAFSIAQVDFAFETLDWPFSDTGRVEIDLARLREHLPHGFVNVATPLGWVVQNLPVPEDFPYDALATYFDIGPLAFDHEPLSSREVWLSYGPEVLTEFAPGAFGVVPVDHRAYNAGGLSAALDEKPEPPLPGGLQFAKGAKAKTTVVPEPALENEQAAHNQCAPMAIANVLKWFAEKHDLTLKGTHKKGLRKDVPNDSVVGILEDKMNRGVTSRQVGQGLNRVKRKNGLKAYLADAKLDGVVKFAEISVASAGIGGEQVRAFIKKSLAADAAVVIDLLWKDTNFPPEHEVAFAGYGIVGKPGNELTDKYWFAIVHDEVQSDRDLQDERGTKDAAGKVIVTASYVTTSVGALNSFVNLPGRPKTHGALAIHKMVKEEKKP